MANQDRNQLSRTRSLAGRIGAHVTHSRHDPRETTKNARKAFAQRFLDQVDPQRQLPERERTRRAESAKKAYFARLALSSAQKRQRASAKRPR